MDDHLRSDEVRDILLNDECEYESDYESDHNSDLHSNVDEFESEIREELGDSYEEPTYHELENAVPTSHDNSVEEEDAVRVEDKSDEEDVGGDEQSWREWKAGDTKFNKFIWTSVSGYKPPQGQQPQTPSEFFHLFFDDNLLCEIVKETNRYAAEKIQINSPLQKRSMWWSWKNITLTELKAFLGVLLNMGINDKPELDDYFTTDWVDYQPFFKDIFSKERFMQLFWTLHVSPPPSGPVAGVLTRSGKIRNVVAYLDQKFRQYYVPQKKVSVDESTVGYKGRVVFKVYNKDKPTKWGIKVFVLSESKTGYICAMEPYFGKITTDRMARQDLGATSRIVLHLVNKLKSTYTNIEGLHVFTDRFYTNLDLATALYDMKIHITGTIMTNRKGLPEQIRSNRKNKAGKIKLKRGEIKSFRKEGKFSVLLWQDTKLVVMLTTLYDNTTKTIQRTKKNGEVEEVEKPSVVNKYNKSMGGVDLADQFISTYSFTRKSIKWWRKIFFWLLETAVVNSFILYNMNQTEKVRQRKFRKMLVKELVGNTRNTRKRGRPSNFVEEERLNGKLHIPYPLDGGKTKDCCVCSDRRPGKERKRSKFYCKTCTNQPGLHMGPCFEKYHSVKKLKD